MRRFGTILTILLAVTSLSGYITFLTEIKLLSDGSRTMVQTMTMNPEQMKDMTESIPKQMDATTPESKTGHKGS